MAITNTSRVLRYLPLAMGSYGTMAGSAGLTVGSATATQPADFKPTSLNFQANLYKDPSGHYTVAIAGTNELGDWTNANRALSTQNLAAALQTNTWDPQLSDAIRFVLESFLEIRKTYEEENKRPPSFETLRTMVDITGHSLGGALAELAGTFFGLPGVNIDGPGISALLHTPEYRALQAEIRTTFPELQTSYSPTSEGMLAVAYSVVGVTGTHAAGATVEHTAAADAAEFAMGVAAVGTLTADPFLALFAAGVVGATASQHGSGHILGQTETFAGLTALANPYSMFGATNSALPSAFADQWDPAAPGSPTLAALRLQTITAEVQNNVAAGLSPMGIAMDGTAQTRGPFSALAFRDEQTGRLVEVYTSLNASGEALGPPIRREYVSDSAGHVGEFNSRGDVTVPWHDAHGSVVGLVNVAEDGVVTATSLLGKQGQFQLTAEQATGIRHGQGNWNDTVPVAHPLSADDLYGRDTDEPVTNVADNAKDEDPESFQEALLDAFDNPLASPHLPGTQLADNGGAMTDGGNQHAGVREEPNQSPLPDFNDYLAGNSLTPAQEAGLAAELDRQHLGGASGISFIRLPDGSTMLQNADGDIVGQLNLQSDGALRWSGIGGERNYIQPDGEVQDQRTADQAAAAMAAAADAHNAAQTAGAVGLLNAVVGLQHWDAMNDVQRAASVVAIYNTVDKLNGGALPGELGSAAAALGLFSALERGDIGGAVYSGLSLVEAATSTAQTAGLVSQTFGNSFLPAVGMVLAIQSGDPVAMASSGLTLLSSMSVIGPWGAVAGGVLTLVNMMFSHDDIPTREGLAHAQWDADGHLQIVTDLNTEGGGASAASWMRGMAESLQTRLAGSGSSLVPGLLPAIGYSLDPDGPAAAHGAPGFVYLRWIDAQGQAQTRYYDGQGNRNDGSGETLAGDFLRHAADAVAPDWAVDTALAHWQQDQTQAAQRPQLPVAAMPDIDTDGLHQTLHALVLGGLAEARAAQLDTDGDGFLERSQWLGRQQAALALDADGNGVIDAGELVGTRGGNRTDLDWLDANRDGILDSRDPAFAALRLWVDADANGRSNPAGADGTETRTLAQAGIVAIDFRTDPPTALHADGSREVFGAQSYVGDVLGNRYDPVEGGVLQRMEQADGSVSSQLLAVNTHAFDGQAEHMHEGQNVEGGESAVGAGDSRLVSTGANTTASTNRRTTTTLVSGDVRIEAGSAGTARSGQAVGSQPANAPQPVVRNSGERGIAVMFADAGTGTGAAMREAIAAMVRSAESGTLAGSSGAGLPGVLAAGMAAWPALADAEPSGPVVEGDAPARAAPAEPAAPGLPMVDMASSFDGQAAGLSFAPKPEAGDRSALRIGQGFGSDLAGPSMTGSHPPPGANAADPAARPSPGSTPSNTQPAASGTSADSSPDHRTDTAVPTTAPSATILQFVRPTVAGEASTDAEDTVQRWSTASLLANDQNRNTLATDATGLHISAVFAPRHGSVSLQAGASGAMQVVFVPDADYHGEAGFSYSVADAFGLESRGEMVLYITPVNDAPVTRDEAASADEDQVLFFRAADLLANDRDVDAEVDGDTLRISRVGAATHGQVFLQPDGLVRFVPDVDYHGPASFAYWVADRDTAGMAQDSGTGPGLGLGLETPATAHLTLLPVNDLPVAAGETLDSDEDAVLRIAPGLLLANDSDVDTATDGQRLSIVAVGNARHGTVSIASDGSIIFVPETDYFGPASFRYTVDDGAGGRADATAVINLAPVNDAPTVLGETVDFDEDQVLTLTQALLLANDSDVDNPASDLRIVAVEHAEHGSVRLDATGNIVFVPDADYFGPAAFRYTVADGAGGFTIGRVALDVAPVNDAPRLVGEQVALDEDEVARFSPAALLANDVDVDNPHAALTIASVGRAEHGSVLLARGEVVFTPDRDYHGAARFSYTVSDGAGGFSDAWVDLSLHSVNDAPTVNGEQLTAKAGVAYTLSQAALLANDSDADSDTDGDVLRIVAVQGAQHGSVVLLADGSIRFAPEVGAGAGGIGSFDYVVEDSAGAQSIATARIDFSRANVAPVATDDSFVGYEDIPLVISAAQLLSNDSDADNTAAQLRLAGVDNASHGSVSLDADGNVRFVADADYSGAASFRYRVVDGDDGESYATAYLQLAAVNDAPVIEDVWFGRPIYGYTYQNVQRYNDLGQMVSDETGRLVTDYLLVDVGGESQARSLLAEGRLYQSDGLTVADHLDTYRNGHLRPVAIDGDTRNLEYAMVQTGVVVAYDPDGNSENITFSLASTPQHGHAWANLYVPFFPPVPGSTSSAGDTQDFLMVPSISTAERGAWEYINVIGDLYTGADPFSMRVTDADGASTLVSIDTWHLGTHYLPSAGGWYPIAIDLGNDGVELIRPQDSNVFADLDGDGKAERLGWTAASDAMLVFDTEGDGSVDMVKDSDFARFGVPGATDLEGLAAFDGNGDGRISALDERWSRLGLVQDRNGNGRQDEGELLTLADAGIESIGLSRSGAPHEDHGNLVFGYTDVRWSDGHVSQAADVMLAGESTALPQRLAQAAPPDGQAHVGADAWAAAQGDAVRTAMVFAQFMNTHVPVDMPGTFAVADFGAAGVEALVVQGLIDAANQGAAGISRLHEAA